jgi:hypothetical protein
VEARAYVQFPTLVILFCGLEHRLLGSVDGIVGKAPAEDHLIETNRLPIVFAQFGQIKGCHQTEGEQGFSLIIKSV